MKTSSKWIALTFVLVAVVALFFAPVYAQSLAGDLKPTFITLTPGLYVHGWPAFTVSYPKDWAVLPSSPGVSFRAGLSQKDLSPSPVLTITVVTSTLPIEDWAKMLMPVYSQIAADIKVLSEKPSQLKDGAPAREVELEFVRKDGPKMNHFILMTKKSLTWISITLSIDRGTIGEDLKSYAYSLAFQPSREEPVNVPPDVRAFLDKYCSDIVSGDVERIMSNYSDQFLHRGQKKTVFEQWLRNDPSAPTKRGAVSSEATVTVFEPRADKAYVDGFLLSKAKGDAAATKGPMAYQQIIKENGQWKWCGNQK